MSKTIRLLLTALPMLLSLASCTSNEDNAGTKDDGNADHALNADGTPNTTHSVNPVPFIYVTENKGAKVRNGILADVAPSVIHIMGLQQPKEMTGKCLIIE